MILQEIKDLCIPGVEEPWCLQKPCHQSAWHGNQREYVFLDILEVSSHSVLEELLSVTEMDFSGRLTSDLEDYNWDPADIATYWQDPVGDLQLQSLYSLEI
jgi:hypothetical protein